MLRPSRQFMEVMAGLEAAYLETDDQQQQCGFSGGRARWIEERSPTAEAIEWDGDFLDVGCANGLLAADIVDWAADRGHQLVPFGIDLGPNLVELARQRHPEHADNFIVADAWTWEPERKWDYVYSLLDLAPGELHCRYLSRLARWVAWNGRLILGSYGSASRGRAPVDVSAVLMSCGFEVAGSGRGGAGPVSRFAWTPRLWN